MRAAHEDFLRPRQTHIFEPLSEAAARASPDMPGQAATAHAGPRGEFIEGWCPTWVGAEGFEDLGGAAIG